MQTETVIEWNGEKHTIPVNMALINRIENAGINLMQMSIDLAGGSIPKFSLVATMYAIMLQSKGMEVTADQVWSAICKNKAIPIATYASAALNAFFPEVEMDSDGEEVKKGKG